MALIAAFALACCGTALADAEQDLATRYAPVVRLVVQEKECGPGEPYLPIDVNALFGQDTVALRGPWQTNDLIKIAPTAADLGRGLLDYHLDFAGNALNPGCDYERWARRITAGTKPTVYAHVATETDHPDKLALQYWLFYVFNDWNNPHEGDWEMIQIVFDAPTPAEALKTSPIEVGYSQHEGAERATWGARKLELVDGTHPVVYPAAGSHANFYGEALSLGASASEGVGCDDTRGPTFEIRPVVKTIPSDPAQARAQFQWIAFEGRWGELQRAFFNGPTGPNLKLQWTEPIRWTEDWRNRSYAVPAGGVLGNGATSFFCGAIAGGSKALVHLAHHPVLVLATLSLLLALVLLGLTRATWRPSAPLRLARRRAWGQILAAAARMYRTRVALIAGIGLLYMPIFLLVTLLQWIVFHTSSVLGIQTGGEGGGTLVLLVVIIGTALTLLGLALVQAAIAHALVEIDAGRPIGPIGAYRMSLRNVGALVGAVVIAVVAVTILLSSLFLLPIALWLAIRWALIVPVVELEGLSAIEALRRSGRLVRQEWLKVASLIIVGGVLALLIGPLAGALLIIFTNAPLPLLDIVAGIVYAVTMPFLALTTAYVYFDARVRYELEAKPESDQLGAEIDFSAPS